MSDSQKLTSLLNGRVAEHIDSQSEHKKIVR